MTRHLLLMAGLLLAVLSSTELSAQTAACRQRCDNEYGDHPGRFRACLNQCPRYQPPSYSNGSQTDWNYCTSATLGTAEERIRHCTTLIDGNVSAQDRAIAYSNRGLNWFELKDYGNAIADYNEALRTKPNDADWLGKRADAYRDNGDFDQALKDYGTAIRVAPTGDNYNARCYGRAAANAELELALADCNEALRRKANDADTRDSRAFVYFRMERLDDALDDLDTALRRNPGLANSLFVRGVIKLKRGDTASGNADLAAARGIDPGVADTYRRYGVVALAAAPAAPRPAPTPTIPPGTQPSSGTTPAPAPATAAADCAQAEAHWKAADSIGTPGAYLDHIRRFPNCAFADLARMKIEAVKK